MRWRDKPVVGVHTPCMDEKVRTITFKRIMDFTLSDYQHMRLFRIIIFLFILSQVIISGSFNSTDFNLIVIQNILHNTHY